MINISSPSSEKIKSKLTPRIGAAAIWWLSVAACMAVIFYLSSRNGSESAEQSMAAMGSFSGFIMKYIGHNVFRKIAHVCEYGLLSFLCVGAMRHTKSDVPLPLSLGLSFLYCISDEIHQIFVPGRACRLFDIFIDSVGILLGACAFYIAARIVSALLNRRKSHLGDIDKA